MQFWSSKFLCLKLLLHLIKELISLRCFMIITIILYYLKLIMVLMRCYNDLSLYFQINFQDLSLSLSFPTFLSSSCFELILSTTFWKCFNSLEGYEKACMDTWHAMELPTIMLLLCIYITTATLNSSYYIKPLTIDSLDG